MAFYRFLFDQARLPKNPHLLSEVNAAAERLFQKLRDFDLSALEISAYNKEYFGGLVNHLESILQMYSYILTCSIADSKKRKEDFVFLDYGAGSGMLCLLAKEYGLGNVVYTDIYDVSLNDARVIAEALCLPADHYILGDVPETLAYLNQQNLSCDCISTHDVIEHIYDVETYFRNLKQFSNGPMTIFMLTVANPLNPFVSGRLKKIQVNLETTDRQPEWWHKGRDSLKSYVSIRKSMIEKYLEQLGKKLENNIVDILAANTRGQIESDICKTVDRYLATGQLPPKPAHPTNTCDPITGNRAENLVDPKFYTKVLREEGFVPEARGSYYWRSPSPVKRPILRTMNWLIAKMGYSGLYIAPALIVAARKK